MSFPDDRKSVSPPVHRHKWRRKAGKFVYSAIRRFKWSFGGEQWARAKAAPLGHLVVGHSSPMLRKLKAVDMQLQHNKVTNLTIAAGRINGLLIKPGEVFSFWYTVGKPTARKGYLEGLVLQNGRPQRGIGGGLCQMGNLIHWMALHTPLTITERWRHSYDVFPDVNRTLPFGSGATLAYNYIDLQIRNDTPHTWQLLVWTNDTHLCGELRCSEPVPYRYEVFEKKHWFQHEPWGGYSRHNVLARRKVFTDRTEPDELILENHALMMYQPFLVSES